MAGDEGVYLLLAHVYLIGPALFVSLGYITTSHYHGDKDTLTIDIACPIAIFVGAIIPYILFKLIPLKSIAPGGEKSVAKVVRWTLSEMRFPGFWDAKVRHERTSKGRKMEKFKDVCAIITFVAFFGGIVILLIGLVAAIMTNGSSAFSSHRIPLYYGETLFKPETNFSGKKLVECGITMDSGFIEAVTNPFLIPGPSWDEHVNDKVLSPNSYPLSIARSFAPGSKVYFNINSTEKMEVYYKRNDTVIKKWEKTNAFKLDFVEEFHTAYLINISASSGVTTVSYDYVADTMTYSNAFAQPVYIYETFMVRPNETIIIWRNSTHPAYPEYVTVYVKEREMLTDILFPYQWDLLHAAVYICACVMILENLIFVIVVFDGRHNFEEKPSLTLHRASSPFGYTNLILIAVALIAFFATGAGLSKSESDELLINNTIWFVNTSIHSGKQILFPVDMSNETGIIFNCTQGNVKVSTISKLPDKKVPRTIDVNPGSVVFKYMWQYWSDVDVSGHIDWNFDSSTEVTVKIYDSYGAEVYYATGMKHYDGSFHPNATGSFNYRITSSVFTEDTAITFKTFKIYTEMYDFDDVTVWSSTDDVELKHTDTPFSFIAVEPAKLDLTPRNFTLRLLEYDSWVESSRIAYIVFCVLLIPCLVALFVVFVFVYLDISDKMPRYLCGDHVDRGEDINSHLPEKPEQLTGEEKTPSTPAGYDPECCDDACDYQPPSFSSEIEPSAPPAEEDEDNVEEEEEEEENGDNKGLLPEYSSSPTEFQSSSSYYNSIQDNLDNP